MPEEKLKHHNILESFTPSSDAGIFKPDAQAYHFSTSLYIDKAVEILRAKIRMVNESLLPYKFIDCNIQVISEDMIRFRLKMEYTSNPNQAPITLVGTMRRWEGSRTRIDADIEVDIQAMAEQIFPSKHRRENQLLEIDFRNPVTKLFLYALAACISVLIIIDAQLFTPMILWVFLIIFVIFMNVTFRDGIQLFKRKLIIGPTLKTGVVAHYQQLVKILMDPYKKYDIQQIDL